MHARGSGLHEDRDEKTTKSSTRDRNAQQSFDPQGRVSTHAAGMHICPALIFCLAQFALELHAFKKKNHKQIPM